MALAHPSSLQSPPAFWLSSPPPRDCTIPSGIPRVCLAAFLKAKPFPKKSQISVLKVDDAFLGFSRGWLGLLCLLLRYSWRLGWFARNLWRRSKCRLVLKIPNNNMRLLNLLNLGHEWLVDRIIWNYMLFQIYLSN